MTYDLLRYDFFSFFESPESFASPHHVPLVVRSVGGGLL